MPQDRSRTIAIVRGTALSIRENSSVAEMCGIFSPPACDNLPTS
jgi:hypothetical protein